MPWKNGGGRTTEIAVHPPGAGLDAFDWRVSIADVEADGPFSPFPGIDRTIVLLDGAGMRLAGGDHAIDLRVRYEPFSFSGDVPMTCTLLSGPVRDFNLMLRRGRVLGSVAALRDGTARIAAAAERLCFVAAGAFECLLPGDPPFTLAAGHTLRVGGGDDALATLAMTPVSPAAVALVVNIDPC